jgi:hypothetical protein
MEAIKIQLSHEPRKLKEYRFLDVSQIIMIDEALTSLGEYGEVRLIVEKGRLRYLVTQKSYDALKWRPGSLDDSD